jgi:hypothetical protein
LYWNSKVSLHFNTLFIFWPCNYFQLFPVLRMATFSVTFAKTRFFQSEKHVLFSGSSFRPFK